MDFWNWLIPQPSGFWPQAPSTMGWGDLLTQLSRRLWGPGAGLPSPFEGAPRSMYPIVDRPQAGEWWRF